VSKTTTKPANINKYLTQDTNTISLYKDFFPYILTFLLHVNLIMKLMQSKQGSSPCMLHVYATVMLYSFLPSKMRFTQ